MAFLGDMPEGSGEPELGLGTSGGNDSANDPRNPAPEGFFASLNRWLDKKASAFSPIPQAPAPGRREGTLPPEVSLNEEKNYAMFSHLLALSGLFTVVGSFVGPLIPWLMKRDASPFVDAHGKESLNFQISAHIVGIVVGFLIWLIGIPTCGLGWLLAIPAGLIGVAGWCYVIVRGSMLASEGKFMAYPFTFRLLK